jgi:integrase
MSSREEVVMAWTERTSSKHWRVRCRRSDGSVMSEGGFPSRKAAQNRAREIEVDQRRHAHHDPALAQLTLDEWLPRWWPTLDIDELTAENYQYLVTKHIGPRFAHLALGDIHSSDINRWSAELYACGYEHSTVQGIIGLLGRILSDAVDDGLIPANPVHHHRNRGKRARHIHREMLWATPEEVLRGALQAAQLHDRGSALLIVTAAWTGCRWGELAGLQRPNTHLDERIIVIDPDLGGLKESAYRQWLGAPKTGASARTVTLPAFLAVLLKHHLDAHDYSPVFANADGGFLWRRSWRTRTFNPAFDGNHDQPDPPVRTHPIRPGLTFHELRHSHKTWLIAAGIPEIAQARRLGHRLDKRVAEVYSHVADEIEARIQAALKQAWLDARHAIAAHPTPPPVTPRTGWIRRRLPNEISPHPAGIVTGSTTHAPPPTPLTCTNISDDHEGGDQYGARCPRITPYSIKATPEDDHQRSTARIRTAADLG